MQKKPIIFKIEYNSLFVFFRGFETIVIRKTSSAIRRIIKNNKLLSCELQLRVNKKKELKKYLLGHIEYIDKKPYLISDYDESILYVCPSFRDLIELKNEKFVYLVPRKNKIK